MKGNTNAAQSITVDNVLSTTSTNPVQNKVVTDAINTNTADITSLEGTVSGKADKANTLSGYGITDAYTETEVDSKLAGKANVANTLSGYGITDAYTKEEINTRLDQNVQRDTAATANSSTVSLNITKGNVNAKSSSTSSVALPVANATQAGVMNPATFQAIQNNAEAIDAILDGTISISTLPSNPSQGDLTNAWKNTTGKDTVINGAKIDDSTNQTVWTYYTNIASWKGVPYSEPSVQVSQWTNSAAGIVKGSTEDGQIFAESDGTGSVNGWDTLKSQVANNESNIASNTSAISTNTADIATNTQNIATNTSDIANLETAIAGTRGVYQVPMAFDLLAPEYRPPVDYEGLKAAILSKKDILIVDSIPGSGLFACVNESLYYPDTGRGDYISLGFQVGGIWWNMDVRDGAGYADLYLQQLTSDNLAPAAVESNNIDWTTLTSNLGTKQGRIYLGDVKIQWGTTQMSMPSGQDVTKVVTFPEAFNHTPIVVVNCDAWIAIRSVFAFDISTTQFTLGAHQVQDSQQNPTFDWLAIG